jgi:hypothetical protein
MASMTGFRIAVDRALATVPKFKPDVARAIVEIAYLAMAVDGELRDEELDAFSTVAAVLLKGSSSAAPGESPSLDDDALRTWLDKLHVSGGQEEVVGRLHEAAKRLGGVIEARRAAYRVVCLMAMSDLDAADREFEFDLDVISSLDLDQDEADQILAEVNAAVTPPEN